MLELRNDYEGLSVARRTAINQHVLSHPHDSYIFCGASGRGKTHLAKAIYFGLPRYHSRFSIEAQDWQDEITAAATGRGDCPIASSKYLRSPRGRNEGPWSLFIDDIDKIRTSEFAVQQLKALLDTMKDLDYQLVLTTSLTTKEALYHTFGDQVARRITEKCKWVLFEEK